MTSDADDPRMQSARQWLMRLCAVEPDRRPGGPGNVQATAYVAAVLRELGWTPQLQWFDCLDWETEGAQITVSGRSYEVTPAPYGRGVSARGPLVAAGSLAELTRLARDPSAPGCVLLVHDSVTRAPLTPRGYPFYTSADDEHVAALIERIAPVAVVAITGRHPDLCGALDPFPFIEDGSFDVPAAAMRPDAGHDLLGHVGQDARIQITSRRRAARAANVVARRGDQGCRVTIVAHIDTKPGTPGALDNATGVVAVLGVAALLADQPFDRGLGVELLVVNGEDHYAAPGEVAYLDTAVLDDVALAVNFDGLGLPAGPCAWSLYACPPELSRLLTGVLSEHEGLAAGPAWWQSDHAVFAARGRPALALTSSDLATALGSVAHAPTDTPHRIDLAAVGRAARAVAEVVRVLDREMSC